MSENTPAKQAPEKKKRTRHDQNDDFPMVVGIGASAGGLEAMRYLLPGLPCGKGLSYVVAQHMDPKHKSMLAELLARHSNMPIGEVRDGDRLEVDKIYVCPPGRDIVYAEGRLHLSTPSNATGPKPSIDLFFNSLAENYPQPGVGVILSGTGSDGAHGVRALKASGGIAIVQKPETAKYDGMPRSAIATGVADLILEPDKIGPELASILSSPQLSLQDRESEYQARTDLMDQVMNILLRRTGSDFSQYKLATLQRRIGRRLALHKLDSLEQYLDLLRDSPEEADALWKDILIAVTSFFRDREAFEALGAALPRLLAGKRPGDSIRVWVPGCSTGEEAYSIAMLLAGHLGESADSHQVQIFGTDIDGEAMSAARRAVFPQASLANVDLELVRRFFRREDNTYQVVKSLRDKIVFARQDIIKDPPFSHMDLISCRNLLIYFTPDLQNRLIPLFHYALNPSGLLFLGKSESVGKHGDLFTAISKKWRIFKRRDQANFNPLSILRPGAGQRREPAAGAGQQRKVSPAELMNRGLADAFGQKAVLLDDQMNVVYARGDLHGLLGIANGEAGLNVLQLAREELRVGLRATIHKAKRENAPVETPGFTLSLDGVNRKVSLNARPIYKRDSQDPYYLLVFLERELTDKEPEDAEDYDQGTSDRINELEQELAATREHLQTTAEELETSNEELQSLNEELQSANEELQSSNEELETSNEELQATNEELTTVNEELQIRTAELAQANSDLENALKRVGVAMVMVDRELKVTRFTPPAAALFDLGPGSSGLMLTGMPSHFEMPDLKGKLLSVIDEGATYNLEVKSQGRLFEFNLFPYLNESKRVAGAVLTFTDRTELHRREMAYRSLTDNSPDIVARFDRDLRHVFVNSAVEEATGRPGEEFLGKTNRDLGMPEELCRQWDQTILEVFRSGRVKDVNFTYPGPNGPIRFQARMVPELDHTGVVRHVLSIARDQTQAYLAAQEEARRASRRRQLLDISRQMLAESTVAGLLQKVVEAARQLTGADLGAAGHGFEDGRFRLGAVSQGEQSGPCKLGEVLAIHRGGLLMDLLECKKTLRLTQAELADHPDRNPLPAGHPRLDGLLGTSLLCRHGHSSGLIMVSGKGEGQFDQEDEDILAQLGGLASLALQNISARQEAEEGAKILQGLMDHLPMGVMLADKESRLLAMSRYGKDLAGEDSKVAGLPPELQAELGGGFLDPISLQKARPENLPLTRAVRRGEVIHDEEWLVSGPEGSLLPVACTAGPIRDQNGDVSGGVMAYVDISVRKKLMTALAAAKQKAEDANQAKSRFLANMSHEIRTPLNSLIGLSHLALGEELDETVREKLEVINSQAELLLALVSDILDISKIEEGALPLDLVEFDMHTLVDEVCEQTAVQANLKNLEYCCEQPLNYDKNLRGDPLRLSQVLLNLLNNAIKFTEKGEVVLKVIPQGTRDGKASFRFEVRDTGPGIPVDQQGGLFDRFTQVQSQANRAGGGSGLGLAISKELVAMMGGEIGLASQEGVGSNFHFSALFPLDQAAPPSNYPDLLPGLEGLRVLVAEPNQTSRAIIAGHLENWGIRAETVDSARAALDILRRAEEQDDPINTALLNWQFHDGSAHRLARTLQEENVSPGAKLVLMSPTMLFKEPHTLEEAGFSAHLAKPVLAPRLFSCLSALNGMAAREQRWRGAEEAARDKELKRLRAGLDLLVVDDNEPNRMVAVAILDQLGYRAQGVESGRQALAALAENKFDLVLMDLQMPDMDGLAATAAIRDPDNDLLDHTVPVVALTANAATEERARCLAAGMAGYLSKPVRPKALAACLDRLLLPSQEEAFGDRASTADGPGEGEEIWDRRALLHRLDQDRKLAEQLVEGFRQDLPAQLEAASLAWRRGDLNELAQRAHTLKGSGANLSAASLQKAAAGLEEAARTGQSEGLDELMENIGQRVRELLEAMAEPGP